MSNLMLKTIVFSGAALLIQLVVIYQLFSKDRAGLKKVKASKWYILTICLLIVSFICDVAAIYLILNGNEWSDFTASIGMTAALITASLISGVKSGRLG